MHKLLKGVFIVLGTALLSVVIYHVFYGVGSWEGVLLWSAEKVEEPLARYYVEFAVKPSIAYDSTGRDLFDSSSSDYSVYSTN